MSGRTATSTPTPMMAQYLGLKEQAGADTLLFYRMGDFYELFFEDAERMAAALDLALVRRGKHNGQPIPMTGVPVHSSEAYIARLVIAGFRVAVCEQTEDPADASRRGRNAVVRREIIRLVTPSVSTPPTPVTLTSEGEAGRVPKRDTVDRGFGKGGGAQGDLLDLLNTSEPSA